LLRSGESPGKKIDPLGRDYLRGKEGEAPVQKQNIKNFPCIALQWDRRGETEGGIWRAGDWRKGASTKGGELLVKKVSLSPKKKAPARRSVEGEGE